MRRRFVMVPVAVLFALAFAEVSDGGGPGSAAERDAAVVRMQGVYQQQVRGGDVVDPHEARFDHLEAADAPLAHADVQVECAAADAGPSEREPPVDASAVVTRWVRATDHLMARD